MALRNIVLEGDPVLRKRCFEVEKFDQKLAELLDDMKQTVKKAKGAGLAGPQVGILRRVAVVDVEEGFFEFVNPKIIASLGEQIDYEGCLSIKGKRGKVNRPLKVTVEYQDRFGKKKGLKAEGFFARAICHEFDHLDGILYIDKAKNIEDERD